MEVDFDLASKPSATNCVESAGQKRSLDVNNSHDHSIKRRLSSSNPFNERRSFSLSVNAATDSYMSDVYCWECHAECAEDSCDCKSCPRIFHFSCIKEKHRDANNYDATSVEPWICPICTGIRQAADPNMRPKMLNLMSSDQLRSALKFALERMKQTNCLSFLKPVPKSSLPDYYDIIFHPMDLSTLESNIDQDMYTSPLALLEDARWILHNSTIYNGLTSDFTHYAKMIINICQQEVSEIELCSDCYLRSNFRNDGWFAEPCSYLHCLVWAKLKGYPFWPAKALRAASNQVDVRFFGAHDRAWVPANCVYLLSEEPPKSGKNLKKPQFMKSMAEMELHIQKLRNNPDVSFKYSEPMCEFKPEYLLNCSILFGDYLSGVIKKRNPSSYVFMDCANQQDSFNQTSEYFSSGNELSNDDLSVIKVSETDIRRPSDMLTSKHDDTKVDIDVDYVRESPDVQDVSSKQESFENIFDKFRTSPSRTFKANASASEVITIASPSETPERVLDEHDSSLNLSDHHISDKIRRASTDSIKKRTLQNVIALMHQGVSRKSKLASKSAKMFKSPVSVNNTSLDTSEVLETNGDELRPAVGPISLNKSVSTLSDNRKTVNSTVVRQYTSFNDMKPSGYDLSTKYTEKISGFLKSTLTEMMDEVQRHASSTSDKLCLVCSQLLKTNVPLTGSQKADNKSLQSTISSIRETSKTTFEEIERTMATKYDIKMSELKKRFEEEKEKAIASTKQKQWCAFCLNEAKLYCCWNTSYCDYPCQQKHWPTHKMACAQMTQPAQLKPAEVSLQQYSGSSCGASLATLVPPSSNVVFALATPTCSSGFFSGQPLPRQPCTTGLSNATNSMPQLSYDFRRINSSSAAAAMNGVLVASSPNILPAPAIPETFPRFGNRKRSTYGPCN